jgi:hypothetical protein
VSIEFVKKKKRFVRTWNVGLYNAYNRANPFAYTIGRGDGGFIDNKFIAVNTLEKQSLIPVLPFVSYGIKF